MLGIFLLLYSACGKTISIFANAKNNKANAILRGFSAYGDLAALLSLTCVVIIFGEHLFHSLFTCHRRYVAVPKSGSGFANVSLFSL